MRIKKIPHILALLATSTVANAQQESAPLKLSSGVYKFAGQCTELTLLGREAPLQCKDFMGIVANDPAAPQFVFALEEGGPWLYETGPAAFSSDGSVAIYPIKTMLDLAANRAYPHPGECVMSARVGDPLVRCTLWNDSSQAVVLRQIVFVGNGTWAFSRNP